MSVTQEKHFGHIGGVFVHADTFARFLRDRIGEENVIFVSGTDCFGSPILEAFRKLKENNNFEGTILDYVDMNHLKQKETLERYDVSLDLYGASALGVAGEIHQEVSKEIFNTLYEHGYLKQLSTPQFYDPEFKVLLNGRQVVGKCPIEGCQSERGYADECSLGHQYMPTELIDPKSTLSGKNPLIKDVTNWYFILDECGEILRKRVEYLRKNSNERKYLLNTIEEFLKPPVIYVQKKQIDDIESYEKRLPKHELINEDKKPSYTFVFENLDDRDRAREIFAEEGIHLRTGKTLVPFRLSGNIEWGVPVPNKDGLDDLTFWVWPESLWAPISFTKAYLKETGNDISKLPDMTPIKLPKLIANNHILFMDKKASSSSEIKPQMAEELLDFYTKDQLRMHFLSLGLANKSVSFMSRVYMEKEKQVGVDIVLKEGNLLTNVYDRLIRSCFYTAQAYYNSKIPDGDVSEAIINESEEAILEYERNMYNHQFHSITYVLDSYIRNMNKYWVNNIRIAETEQNDELRKQLLIDGFYIVKTVAVLLHPIAPEGCELVREYLNVGKEMFHWDNIFKPMQDLMKDKIKHRLLELEPRFDFFKKHPTQFINE